MKKVEFIPINHLPCLYCDEPIKIDATRYLSLFVHRDGGYVDCDECGAENIYKQERGEIFGEVKEEPKNTRVLLVIPPTDKPIFLLARGQRYSPKKENDLADFQSYQYLYEQHRCPENTLHDICAVTYGGEPDPHGIMKLLLIEDGEIEWDDEKNHLERMIQSLPKNLDLSQSRNLQQEKDIEEILKNL